MAVSRPGTSFPVSVRPVNGWPQDYILFILNSVLRPTVDRPYCRWVWGPGVSRGVPGSRSWCTACQRLASGLHTLYIGYSVLRPTVDRPYTRWGQGGTQAPGTPRYLPSWVHPAPHGVPGVLAVY